MAFTCSQRDEVRNLHDVSGAIQAQPGMKHRALYLLIAMALSQDSFLFHGIQNKKGGILIHEDSFPMIKGVCRGGRESGFPE